MVANTLEINPQRLWDSLERSAEIGRFRGTGLRRLALSAEDRQMRDLFVDWARQAGCKVEIDRLGNIFARRPGSDPSLPPVAIGSHLDTQICGGRYDGILGVLCGLEVPPAERAELHERLARLGFGYADETENVAARLFLR